MSYDTATDPYFEQEYGVLKNKLGLTDGQKLKRFEASVTHAAISALADHSLDGSFNLAHLQAIHKHVFGEIYAWAGDLRSVDISKGDTRFARAEVLEQAANELFGQLANENYLLKLPKEEFLDRLTHYYSELNVLHPFREGNGRTQRAFFSLLAEQAGYRLAWEHLEAQANLQAVIAAYQGNEQPLRDLLGQLLEPLPDAKQPVH